MMLKTMQFNDHLPLTLGERVTLRPEERSRLLQQPVPLDIDLTVRWVGDIMDDEVQVSDINHPAAPQASEKFARQLFGRALAQQASIAKGQTATGGDAAAISRVWGAGNHVLSAADVERMRDMPAPTATGLQILMQAETKRIDRLREALLPKDSW